MFSNKENVPETQLDPQGSSFQNIVEVPIPINLSLVSGELQCACILLCIVDVAP